MAYAEMAGVRGRICAFRREPRRAGLEIGEPVHANSVCALWHCPRRCALGGLDQGKILSFLDVYSGAVWPPISHFVCCSRMELGCTCGAELHNSPTFGRSW